MSSDICYRCNSIGNIFSNDNYTTVKLETEDEKELVSNLLDINEKHGLDGVILGVFDEIIGAIGVHIPPKNEAVPEGIYDIIAKSLDSGTPEHPFALYDLNNESLGCYVFEATNYATRGSKNRFVLIINTDFIENHPKIKQSFSTSLNPIKQLMNYTKEVMKNLTDDYTEVFESKKYVSSKLVNKILIHH